MKRLTPIDSLQRLYKAGTIGEVGSEFLAFVAKDVMAVGEAIGQLLIPLLSHKSKLDHIQGATEDTGPRTETLAISLPDAMRRTKQTKQLIVRTFGASWQQLAEDAKVVPAGSDGHVLASISVNAAGYRNATLQSMLISWLLDGAPLGPMTAEVLTRNFPAEEITKYLRENIPSTRAKPPGFGCQRRSLA